MDNGSYIKLHRKMLEWEWYKHGPTMRLFLHLLLIANWKESSWRGIQIHPGDVIRSDKNLAAELGLTIRQVKYSISVLRTSGELSSRKEHGTRIITVNNWGQYQKDVRATSSKASSGLSPEASLERTTVKEVKEVKKLRSVSGNTPPTREEVRDFCYEMGYQNIDVDKFYEYNEAKGWKMDWQKAVVLWYQNEKKTTKTNSFTTMMQHDDWSMTDLERQLLGMEEG